MLVQPSLFQLLAAKIRLTASLRPVVIIDSDREPECKEERSNDAIGDLALGGIARELQSQPTVDGAQDQKDAADPTMRDMHPCCALLLDVQLVCEISTNRLYCGQQSTRRDIGPRD